MRILVVENESRVARLLKISLEAETYCVEVASTADEAMEMTKTRNFDLIILALILSEGNGFKVLERLRTHEKQVPLLVLSSNASVEERVICLDSGADDYMTKPFAIRELLARVRALLRRGGGAADVVLRVADLVMNRMEWTVRRGEKRIELSRKEFALLEYFMRNPGRPLSRPTILEHAWNSPIKGCSNVVDVYVNYLRNKVDRGFERKLIRTVRGVGYQMRALDEQISRPHFPQGADIGAFSFEDRL